VGCPDGLGAEAGPQMFTGLTSAPTMLTGAFTSTEFDVFVSSTTYIQANNTIQAVIPEPSTLLTLAAGFLALGGLRLYRRN
jgi:PEP-CTERM motif